ncbi:UNVERIFIED_CONTAM: hypothetical protein NCL1_28430 [Trichonephila clavipes]
MRRDISSNAVLCKASCVVETRAIAERSRLPDSLRWRAVGWMEMVLLQANAARRLNVSRSVVHTVSEINIKPKHLCPEDMFQSDHELQHLQEIVLPLFRLEGEEGFRCRNLLGHITSKMTKELTIDRN